MTGFASDENRLTAAKAVVTEAAKQIQDAAAATVQGSRRKLQSLDRFDTASMVGAAANDTQVTLSPNLKETLAATTATAAQYASLVEKIGWSHP